MSSDLPDYTRTMVINVDVPESTATPTRPMGGIISKGTATTTASYATIATRTVTTGKSFQVAKIVVSSTKAAFYKLRWNGTDISSERHMDDGTIAIEHFPWNYYTMAGDGAKAFDVQAKYDTEAGTTTVEIDGEEVTT